MQRAMTIPPIPVDAWLSALPGEALRLTVSDGESFATFEGDRVEEAKSRAMTREDAQRFMALYGRGDAAEALPTSLASTGDPEFPWQLPGVRRFGLIVISTKEGENT